MEDHDEMGPVSLYERVGQVAEIVGASLSEAQRQGILDLLNEVRSEGYDEGSGV